MVGRLKRTIAIFIYTTLYMYVWAGFASHAHFRANIQHTRVRTLSRTPLHGFPDYNNSTRRADIGRQSAASNRIPDSRKCNVTRSTNSLPNLFTVRATGRERPVEFNSEKSEEISFTWPSNRHKLAKAKPGYARCKKKKKYSQCKKRLLMITNDTEVILARLQRQNSCHRIAR